MQVKVITDRVLFIFPKSRELQFAAAAVLQDYVNGYSAKMKANNPDKHGKPYKTEFNLLYDVDVSPEDWEFFSSIGLKLDLKRTPLEERPDAVFDFSEDKILPFKHTGRHVTQVMGIMCGASSLPLPIIKQEAPKKDEPVVFGRIDDFSIDIESGKWTGFILDSGWQAYLAASMGLPVIEICDTWAEDRYWLAKWTNRAWRVVDSQAGNVEEQIASATKDISEVVKCLRAAQDKGRTETAMEASMSTAYSAENS